MLYNAVNLGSNLCSMPDFRRLLRTNIAVGDNGLAWQADNTVAKLVGAGPHILGWGIRVCARCV